MTRAFLLLAAAALPLGPAFAQDHGAHGGHGDPPAETKAEPAPVETTEDSPCRARHAARG